MVRSKILQRSQVQILTSTMATLRLLLIIPMEFIIITLQLMRLTSMAMGTMELRALFLNSILFLLLISCSPEKEKMKLVDQSRVSVKHSGGVVYVNDSIFTGTLFSLDPDSKDTLELASFLNGREHGAWKQFYQKGAAREIRYFENGKKQGEYKGWWPDGTKKFIFQFKDDEYNGTCYEWAENGQLTHQANYKQGHEEGAQAAWYTNGKIRSNYTIINGRRYGLLGTRNCKNVSDSVFSKR